MNQSGILCHLICVLIMPVVLWAMVIGGGFAADFFFGEQALLDWYQSRWKREVLAQILADGRQALIGCYFVGLTLYLTTRVFGSLVLRWLLCAVLAAALAAALLTLRLLPNWQVAATLAAVLFVYGAMVSLCALRRYPA